MTNHLVVACLLCPVALLVGAAAAFAMPRPVGHALPGWGGRDILGDAQTARARHAGPRLRAPFPSASHADPWLRAPIPATFGRGSRRSRRFTRCSPPALSPKAPPLSTWQLTHPGPSPEKTKVAQAVVSQVDTRTGAALRAPTYSRSRSRSHSTKTNLDDCRSRSPTRVSNRSRFILYDQSFSHTK